MVDADTGRKPALSASGVRWIIPVAVLFIPYVGTPGMLIVYLWLLLDFRRQGLHDKAANTLVVRD